ncbi:MAG: DUF2058 domain-containing protein [Candidatus Hydrogenedentes bacterium]|nr:DUF2058 domain-containing protein [Candidatus Hydrogenedentota bacterium]
MGDLRDQLLKAGLASKKAVKAVETEERRENKKKLKEQKKSGVAAPALAAAQQALAEKAEADRLRAAAEKAAREEKELRAQVADMIEQHALKKRGKGLTYHFPHDKVVKKLEVSEETQRALSLGKLAIVFWENQYRLVPGETADKIDARLPDAIVYWCAPAPGPDEDDPYKSCQVPDDLMW